MALYVISYDYRNNRNYDPLYALLERWNAKPLLESVWLANLNGSAPAVRRELVSTGDGDESFAVIELKPNSDWATTPGVKQSGVEWLETHL